jgi:hypothetical protein
VQKLISSEVFSSQVIKQPTRIPSVRDAAPKDSFSHAPTIAQPLPVTPALTPETSTSALSFVTSHQQEPVAELSSTRSLSEKPQILPTNQKTLTPGLTVDTNTLGFSPVIQDQKQSLNELKQQQSAQRTGKTLPLQVQKVIRPQIYSADHILEESVAIPSVSSHNTPVIDRVLPSPPRSAVDTSTPALSPVIQSQASSIPSTIDRSSLNSHKQIDNVQQRVNFPDSQLSDFREEIASNLSTSTNRGKDRVQSSYFRRAEVSDLKPLSQPTYDLSRKKYHRLSFEEHRTLPAIQVKIGRLEIRTVAPAPPPPRPKPRPAPSVMSLDEYLQRRVRRR